MFYPNSAFVTAHRHTPNAVGSSAETSVHFTLPVSLRIVSSVVEHGQCIMQNSMAFSAVSHVQPFARSKALISASPAV